ncbi:MAG: hypothetical protein IPP14_09405 [Planctomycetes bacterium]|nr:hypothetical protein [Planctomycetota bacterium]
MAVSPRRGRQNIAPGVSPGSAAPHRLSPAGATQALLGVLALMLLAACNQPPKTNGEIDVKPDIIRPSEAQSNFLDIGTQAGIEWLSFVPNDQNEYPDFFTGLDSDQKRRLRVAPLENPDERVLLEFKLPQGSKLWPVDWYGTELMAMEAGGVKNLSLALAKGGRDPAVVPDMIARSREKSLTARGMAVEVSQDGSKAVIHSKSGQSQILEAVYACRELRLQHSTWLLIAEWVRQGPDIPAPGGGAGQEQKAVEDILSSISIKRELALEGMPKHKCTSSLDELKQGKLVFPGGTLNLPLKDGQVARKTGGDSTIQVDGEGAKPWLLIRRLKEDDAPGDLRVRVRNDATFSRRTGKNPKGFGVGRRLEDSKIDAVVWDYTETAAEQQLLGVIAIGNELLSIEVVSRGLREGDSRRAARDAALALLVGATGTGAKGDPLKVLEGWNVGTMGKGQ